MANQKKEWIANYAINLAKADDVSPEEAAEEEESAWAQAIAIYHHNVASMGGKVQGKRNKESGHLARIAKLPRKRKAVDN